MDHWERGAAEPWPRRRELLQYPPTCEEMSRRYFAGGREAEVPPLRTVAAPNAFKGTLDALDAAEAICAGVRDADASARATAVPMADGGDGTAAVLGAALGAVWRTAHVPGPWGDQREAAFALLPDGTAVVDIAAASGLGRLRPGPREAVTASTLGTGMLVAAALGAGARRVWLALGGSATSDGGTGILRALGARFLDPAGRDLPLGAAALAHLARVDLTTLVRPRDGVTALVDVRNPLLGSDGSAAVFGPQKGADRNAVLALENGLARFADVLEATTGCRVRDVPGAGAAGGAGFGLAAAMGACIRSGAEVVAEAVGLRGRLAACDLCFTGEGRLDGQTALGKAPAAVGALAAGAGVPAVALCGDLGPGWEGLLSPRGPFAAILPLAPGPRTRAEALAATAADLRRTAAAAVRLFTAANRLLPGS